jgi:putative DNA primase/helicase
VLKPVPQNPQMVTLADLLASVPEHQRDLYTDLHQSLPPQYTLYPKGIARKSHNGMEVTPFCSPFRVQGLVKNPKTKLWARVIELIDPADDLATATIPEGILTGKPREAIARLSDCGLRVFDEDEIRTILQLIRNWEVPDDAKLQLIDRVGWVPEKDAFALPTGRVLSRPGVKSKYSYGGPSEAKEIGDLDLWRDQTASLSLGNPNLIFAISLGFSSALMPFTEQNTVIFHFFGKTSTGKTRVLRAGLSVWPSINKKEKTWNGTANGLEAEIAESHSILMGLDELRADATPDLPLVIYQFANGSEKGRAKKEGGSQGRKSWNTAVISTGEYSFQEIVRKLGALPTGGQQVRMFDIPAEGTYGVFDCLHGSVTSEEFVNRLDRAIKKSHGPAGTAFAERLVSLCEDDLEDMLAVKTRPYISALQQHLGVVVGDPESAALLRVIKSFALVATAGELATEWGITGWAPGTASEAVGTIAQMWMDNRNRAPVEETTDIDTLRNYISENIARFIKFSDIHTEQVGDLLGYQDQEFIYILPATISKFNESNKKRPNILNALVQRGYLDKGGENKSLQFRLPSIVRGRPRVYRIRRNILNLVGG